MNALLGPATRGFPPVLLATSLAGSAVGTGCERLPHDSDQASIPEAWLLAAEFGRENTPFREVIGEVTDVVPFSGNYVLLDAMNSRLSLINPETGLISTYERSGQGPGEFRVPATLGVVGDHTLFVADRANRRFSIFSTVDDSLAYQRDIALEHESRDLCALDGSVIVLGDHEGRMLHLYDSQGRKAGSVTPPSGGPPEIPPEDPSHDRLLANGFILCDDDHDRILFSSTYFGFVRVLDSAGAEVRTIQLPLFRPMAITPDGGGGVQMANPEGFESYHRTIGVTKGFGYYWIQIAEDFGRNAADRYKYSNVLIADDLTEIRSPAPSPFAGPFIIDGRTAVASTEDPYPRLLFMRPDTTAGGR